MGLFNRKQIRDATADQIVDESVISDPLLKALLGSDEIDRDSAMNIPSISACINKIGDTISTIQIKLYKKNGDKIEEVENDPRLFILNHETGDTLDAVQFKKAMITDMFLAQGGYAYVHKIGTEVRSIHYVEANKISFWKNSDPIFKDYKIQCNGTLFEGWQWIKLLRNTTDGMRGKSIIEESNTLLSIIYSSQIFERNLVKTGGNKKGFIQSTTRLTKEAMTALKNAFRNLYSNNSENVVILNDGLTFKESANTSVELQLNENKETNGKDVCKIFLIPPPIIEGGATEDDRKAYHEECIVPILEKFATAINAVMLNEEEKGTYFFAFDTDDLLKGDIEKRFEAYKTALDSGFMQMDEVRKKEKLPAYGLDFIKLGLQDVLYYPDTNQIYTPNTNKLSVLGEESEDPKPSPQDLPENIDQIDNDPDDPPENKQKGGEDDDES